MPAPHDLAHIEYGACAPEFLKSLDHPRLQLISVHTQSFTATYRASYRRTGEGTRPPQLAGGGTGVSPSLCCYLGTAPN